MKARMTNPIMLVPDAMQSAMALGNASKKGDVPAKTLDLVHLRVSQHASEHFNAVRRTALR